MAAKVGRPKLIPTPEAFWGLFLDYKIDAELNPVLVHDFVGKDGNSCHREKQRCLTMAGFENYLEDVYGIGAVQQYLENRDKRYDEFVSIVARVRREIREDQITGGMVGIYNSSITARLQGLAEKTESVVDNNVKLLNIDPL